MFISTLRSPASSVAPLAKTRNLGADLGGFSSAYNEHQGPSRLISDEESLEEFLVDMKHSSPPRSFSKSLALKPAKPSPSRMHLARLLFRQQKRSTVYVDLNLALCATLRLSNSCARLLLRCSPSVRGRRCGSCAHLIFAHHVEPNL
jgi:hypothetical protein